MTVTLRKPDIDDYRNFSKEVKERAKAEYGDFDYEEEEVSSMSFANTSNKREVKAKVEYAYFDFD